jgi:superfamily II DNA or RNA helicase
MEKRFTARPSMRDLNLPKLMTTSTHDLTEDFFVPLLSMANRYDRGVGYFSSGWLRTNASGLTRFAEQGGVARWIVSPILSQEDWEAMQLGDRAKRDQAIAQSISRSVDEIRTGLETETLATLAWLICDNIIQFKLAVPRRALAGEFHDKFGIFSDDHDRVSFGGSYNDSIHGLTNYESIKIFRSWDNCEAEYVEDDVIRFKRLWTEEDPNVAVYSIPDATRNRILELRSAGRPYRLPIDHATNSGQSLPFLAYPLRPYQNSAIDDWLEGNGRGIFSMATGSGKTITALSACVRLSRLLGRSGSRVGLIILCPFQHLVSQWDKVAREFGFDPIRCVESRRNWFEDLNSMITAFNTGAVGTVCAIATYATFRTTGFQDTIRSIRSGGFLLIGDEVHNLGTEVLAEKLPEQATYRLGLSATPERPLDDLGTNRIFDYFGPTIFTYGLDKAIQEHYLCPYDYFPEIVELTEEESDRYLEISRKLAQIYHAKGQLAESDASINPLLLQRARLLGSASGKLDAVRKIMRSRADSSFNFIYCGDGQVDYAPSDETLRQVDAVSKVLGNELGMKVNTYTAETPLDVRGQLMSEFDAGRLQALIAIRCLDEGVDVPATRTAIMLASSTNPRQFVQRRGRVLRNAKGKDHAEIFDTFVVLPASFREDESFNVERSLVRRELLRAKEFASSARNGPAALLALLPLRSYFNLLDV